MGMRSTMAALACLAVVVSVGCGGGSPTSPSGGSGSGSGGSTGGGGSTGVNRGTITAVIDGVPFTGIATAATNQSGIFATASANAANTISFGFGALAAPGTTAIGATSPTNAQLVVVSGNPTQSWSAGTSGGAGTLAITSISATGASGTFAFTMVPSAGSTATGSRSITSGTFSVTF